MTFAELVKKAIPGANEAVVDYVLWNRTAFPFDGSPKAIFKAADGYRRACLNGIQLCELCDRPAVDGWNCEACNKALAA